MATGINVDVSHLQEHILKLEELRNRIAEINSVYRPSKVGGGDTVDNIEELADIYTEIGQTMDELIRNSVDYFVKVKNVTLQTNQMTSSAISGN